MGDVYFTSDTHFGHRAMIEHGWRPQYASVPDMNADLIERWNSTVRPDDTVWHLGDWGLGPAREHLPILAELHGTVHLIAGNHDPVWPGSRDAHKHQAAWIAAGFASVQAFARRRVDGRQVLLSHFPYDGDHTDDARAEQYRLRDLGEPLLHGHVHDAWTRRGGQINVGVDVRGFAPVHLDVLRAELNELASEGTEQDTGPDVKCPLCTPGSEPSAADSRDLCPTHAARYAAWLATEEGS